MCPKYVLFQCVERGLCGANQGLGDVATPLQTAPLAGDFRKVPAAHQPRSNRSGGVWGDGCCDFLVYL